MCADAWEDWSYLLDEERKSSMEFCKELLRIVKAKNWKVGQLFGDEDVVNDIAAAAGLRSSERAVTLGYSRWASRWEC